MAPRIPQISQISQIRFQQRTIRVICVICVFILAASPLARAQTVDEQIGLAIGGGLPTAEDLDLAAGAGARIVRLDFLWHEIEPTRGRFVFTAHERAVDEARRRGLEVLAILCYGVPWASRAGAAARDPHYPPDDPADFARFVRAAVARFRGRVRRFEVWNEPNAGIRFWKSAAGGDARAYGRLIEAAYRAAKEADPACEVAFAGVFGPALALVPSGARFIEEAHRAIPGLAASYDAVAYHPYRYPFTAPEARSSLQVPLDAEIRGLRAVLDRLGARAKPIWITEMGWHTGLVLPGVSEREQARYAVRGAALALAAGAEMFLTFTLRDGPRSSWWQEDAFGLFRYDPDRSDGAPPAEKPAARAYRTLARELAGTRFAADLSPLPLFGTSERALLVLGAGRARAVLWRTRGRRALAAPWPRPVTVVDLEGRERRVAPEGGLIRIEVSEDPVFLRLE